MFNRPRDGPVVTVHHAKRPCLTFRPANVQLKRKRGDDDDANPLAQRFRNAETEIETGNQQQQTIGRKRSAAFDDELQHLEKRMRATVPTAEEAIAFLLPHIVRLRHMYNESQQKVDELSKNNVVLRKTCTYLITEKKRLESAVALANYRVALSGPKPYAFGHTE